MKTKAYFPLIIIVCCSLLFTNCSSNDDDSGTPNNNNQQIAEVENTVELGTWFISSFIDSGQDETNDFNGFTFTFATDGTITANRNTETKTGTWSVTDSSNSNDDSNSQDDIDFNINFPVPDTDDFEDLNDDWDIVSYSDTMISLIDISGGNGGTDTLIFQKN